MASSDPAKAEIDGQPGAVLGRACGEDGRWSYAVSMDVDGVCWFCWEAALRPTGEFGCREEFYDGSSLRISQDGELLGHN